MTQKVALIRNPASRLNCKQDNEFEQIAREWLGDKYLIPSSKNHVSDIIAEFANQNIECIIIDGGDGTISHVMTEIYHSYPADKMPSLIILPSGNTNLIAKDIGFGARGAPALRRIKKIVEHGRLPKAVQHRYALKVEWPDKSQKTVLGMFCGTAAFTRAIQIAHEPTILNRFPHDWAVGVTIIFSFLKFLSPKTRDEWMRGDSIQATLNNNASIKGNYFILLYTTLHSLSHGVWPFWDNRFQKDGINYLHVKAYPPRVLSACCAFLLGRIPSWVKSSDFYESGKLQEINLKLGQKMIMDGEELSSDKDCRIKLSVGPRFSFVRL